MDQSDDSVRPRPGEFVGTITGWGAALPEKRVTNADLEEYLDTTDEWIVSRSGIEARHVGGTTGGLAAEASRRALERAGISPSDLDLLILATSTPDGVMPPTSVAVAAELGATCGSFDLNAACGGFAFALLTANGFLALGARRVLVIGVDTLSRITDWNDRNTAVLFGDGAGAVVVERLEHRRDLLAWATGTETRARHLLTCDTGSTIKMEGNELFRQAVRVVVRGTEDLLTSAGLTAADISLFVPHQANKRIIIAAGERLGIPEERLLVHLAETGNTSAASIPLALSAAADEGRINDGDLLLLMGFGAGLTWAAVLIRWHTGLSPAVDGERR